MKNGFCLVGITLILAGLIMSYQNMENGKFKTFNNLLDNEQKKIYQDRIIERLSIYNTGLFIGFLIAAFFYYRNRNEKYILCKAITIMSLFKLGFYYIVPKSPLMLYSLTTKEQTDAWADIYIEMKKKWKLSWALGFIGYITIVYSLK